MDNQQIPPADSPTPPLQSPIIPAVPKSKSNLYLILILLIFILLIGTGGFFLGKTYKTTPPDVTQPKEKPCTQEAKICPDGSAVGRTGPNCEFAPCPTMIETIIPTATQTQSSPISDSKLFDQTLGNSLSNWKTYTGKYYSLKFPSSWYLSESDPWRSEDLSPIIKLSPMIKETQFITIIVSNNSTNLTLNEFIQKERGLNPNTFEQITIDNQIGLINPNYISAFDSEIVLATYKDKVFEITLTKSPGEKIEKTIFDQILSTFKFLN